MQPPNEEWPVIKIVTFSTLYPDAIRHRHGIFVETRLRHLVGNGQVESRVIAPVPWFPSKHPRFGAYAKAAQVAAQEVRHDISIQHPRYLLLPKIGMTLAPLLMAVSVYRAVKRLQRSGYDFDIIDAHYFYPDGVAAVLLGQWLNKPVVITARGTDLNLIPQYVLPRKQILWAAKRAQAMITVCQALKDVLLEMGVADERVTVLRNGVDFGLFYPESQRDDLRARLGITGKTILSVGHLVARKGHDLVIQSLQHQPDVSLLIAGDGEEEDHLRACVVSLRLEHRVTFLGALTQTELRDYYAAVDALVLASSREGWANVLLESMACGTPVVATNVWGTPEVVSQPEAGVLVERDAHSIAQGLIQLFEAYPDRAQTRRYAEQFSWESTTEGQEQLFARILAQK